MKVIKAKIEQKKLVTFIGWKGALNFDQNKHEKILFLQEFK